MMRIRKQAMAVAFMAGVLAANAAPVSADTAPEHTAFTIATGKLGGLYHPVGGALCALLRESQEEHGVACTVEITNGSIDNIEDLRDNDAQLAIVQSDTLDSAFNGVSPFAEDEPFAALRSVMALYLEQLTVVVGAQSDIKTFDDLRERRVYIGHAGSGRRQTAEAVMAAHGLSSNDIIDVAEIAADDQAIALCNNEFDAFITTAGNPNAILKKAIATCGARLLPLDQAIVDRLIANAPYYRASTIPAGMYPGVTVDTPTVATVAVLVTTAAEPAAAVDHLVGAVFANLDRLRDASAIFATVTDSERFRTGITAPLHEGAISYATKAGLMPADDGGTFR